jgi:hypothetical protein
MSACEICERTLGNENPFTLDDGRVLKSVCGGCKFKLTFTPERKAKFEREMSIVCTEMLNERVDVKVKS